MIRGPVLPQLRDALWAVVAGELGVIERGLTLVLQGVDCSAGQLGLVDGLARDASAAPVLVLLAVDGDAQLAARAFAAVDFLHRVGDALARAVPEASLCPTAPGRVLVVGTDVSAGVLDQVSRIAVPGLWVCRLEPFRIGSVERFAVRWLASERGAAGVASPAAVAPPFVAPAAHHETVERLLALCARIDAGVRVDGDRYWRRITWCGRLLGDLRIVDGALHGGIAGETPRVLGTPREHRAFADRLLRRYLQAAGLSTTPSPDEDATAAPGRETTASRHAVPGWSGSPRASGDGLRSALAAARLSPEEYSALGDPASAAGGETEAAAMAVDVARPVAGRESSWAPPGRTD